MFAVAFDLEVAATTRAHPRGLRQAYADVEKTLARFGFERVQGSVYVTKDEDLTKVVRANECLEGSALVAGERSRHPRLPGRTMVGLHVADQGMRNEADASAIRRSAPPR